jgi:hypothetical protein
VVQVDQAGMTPPEASGETSRVEQVGMIRSRIALALALSVSAVVPVAGAGLAVPSSAFACNGTTGRINGVSKCLRAGEFCTKSAAKQYIKYGYACTKRDANGRWHLVSN